MNDCTSSEIKAPPLALLFPVVSLANFMAVFYTPALPSIMKYFNITSGYAESSMYFYLLFVAIGCLIYGPISNRFGRKPALCVGFGLAIVGTLLCILAGVFHSFALFDIGRSLQALGGAAGLQVGFTVIGDCYRPPKSIKITSYISLAFAIGPSIAITIGGLLTSYVGWQGCFYFIEAYLITLFVLVMYLLPETLLIKHHDSLQMKKILFNYYVKFKKSHVLLVGLAVGFVVAFFYLFSVAGPFIGITFLKLSPKVYGLYNLIPPVFTITGCLLTAFLTKYLKPFTTMLIGLFVLLISSISAFLFFIEGYVTIATLFLPFSVALIGVAFIQNNALGLALHHSMNKSLTSSVVMFINTMVSTLVVSSLSFNKSQSLLMLPTVFLVLAGVSILLYFALRKSYKALIGKT